MAVRARRGLHLHLVDLLARPPGTVAAEIYDRKLDGDSCRPRPTMYDFVSLQDRRRLLLARDASPV